MRQRLVEFDEYISPDGETYKFRNGIDKFVISGTNGLGLPPIAYRTQRGPFQDGETVLGFNLTPRLITVIHRQNACDRDGYWDIRSALLDSMRPNRQSANQFAPGVLRKTLPDGSQRDLAVLVSGGLQFLDDPTRWDEFSVQDAIQFIAHNPVLFDPTAQSLSYTTVEGGSLVFPFTYDGIDMVFGTSTLAAATNLTYTGTWLTYPTITITGPVNQPKITNVTTDEKIEMNYEVSSGEVVTISLEYGNKTVTNDLNENLIGYITTDSDLATFHIAADPEAPGGVNEIEVFGSDLLAGTSEVVLSYFVRYIGI